MLAFESISGSSFNSTLPTCAGKAQNYSGSISFKITGLHLHHMGIAIANNIQGTNRTKKKV